MREQRELLTLLGLKRRAKPVQSLAEITAELVEQEQCQASGTVMGGRVVTGAITCPCPPPVKRPSAARCSSTPEPPRRDHRVAHELRPPLALGDQRDLVYGQCVGRHGTGASTSTGALRVLLG